MRWQNNGAQVAIAEFRNARKKYFKLNLDDYVNTH